RRSSTPGGGCFRWSWRTAWTRGASTTAWRCARGRAWARTSPSPARTRCWPITTNWPTLPGTGAGRADPRGRGPGG
ncbi:unnamed protein product, partial [Heterosigma akashiwo]